MVTECNSKRLTYLKSETAVGGDHDRSGAVHTVGFPYYLMNICMLSLCDFEDLLTVEPQYMYALIYCGYSQKIHRWTVSYKIHINSSLEDLLSNGIQSSVLVIHDQFPARSYFTAQYPVLSNIKSRQSSSSVYRTSMLGDSCLICSFESNYMYLDNSDFSI